MRLTPLNNDSAGGRSPHVYATDLYNLVVQGVKVTVPETARDAGEIANTIPTLLAVDAICQLAAAVTESDFDRMLRLFGRSAFRLETLPQYVVDEEADALAAFRAGGNADTPYIGAWWRLIADHVAAGHSMRRVHLVRLPLSEYLRWEFVVQAGSVDAGEDIRVVDLDEHRELAEGAEDFWLFDDRVAVRMLYDQDGRLLRLERVDNDGIERCRAWRDRTWEVAVPLSEFRAGV